MEGMYQDGGGVRGEKGHMWEKLQSWNKKAIGYVLCNGLLIHTNTEFREKELAQEEGMEKTQEYWITECTTTKDLGGVAIGKAYEETAVTL